MPQFRFTALDAAGQRVDGVMEAADQAEVVARLANVPLKGGFRDRYAYDNILYAVAQQVIEKVSGLSYADFLQQRIFDKVGMAGTRYNADHLKPGDKAAIGHAKFDFTELRPVPPLTWSNAAGAGGIYSSVHDLSKWMNVQLAEGKLADGTALFSEKTQQQMLKALMLHIKLQLWRQLLSKNA